MKQRHLDLGPFISWEQGQNFPFSACMAKLMACLGGDPALYTYDFFAGVSGDDFIMAYGDHSQANDCVSVCEDTAAFCARVFGLLQLEYTICAADAPQTLERIQALIDRSIPVLVKSSDPEKGSNYDLVVGYADDLLTVHCGDPQWARSYRLGEETAEYVLIDTLPKFDDLAALYRAAYLQIPTLMTATAANGAVYGAAAYHRWAEDLERCLYDGLTAETFRPWWDWEIYLCNLATNARHGRDFLARAYLANPDLPNILQLLVLLERNMDCWNGLNAIHCGFGATIEALQASKTEAARLIRQLAARDEEILRLF